jgi:hypothetical protein
VNLVFEDRIVSLQNYNTPKTPLTMALGPEIGLSELGLNIGDRVKVYNKRFTIRLNRFEFGDAHGWDARLVANLSKREQIMLLNKTISQVLSFMGAKIWCDSPTLMNPALAVTVPVLQALEKAVDEGKEKEWVSQATSLVGLGPGLTPSGDDFLVGFLSSLQVMEDQSQRIAAFAERLRSTLGDAVSQTTFLSREFLCYACQGDYAEPFHKLYAAATALDQQKTLAAVTWFMGIGHTSGSDGLSGILYGLRFCGRLLYDCLPGDLGR